MGKSRNRYVILFIAAIVNFCYGSVYIWTIFHPEAMSKFGLDSGAANRPFNVFMGFFVVGNILGGKLQQKLGTRITVLLGSFFMCLGFLLTSFIPSSIPYLLNITYGMLGGIGAGTAYNALIAGIQKWFPDKRGMVTGIVICTVGAPGLIMGPLVNACIVRFGFSVSMLIVTGVFATICFGLGWMIVDPPEDYDWQFDISLSSENASSLMITKQFTTKDLLKTPQYYLVTVSMMFALTSYFLINPMMLTLGLERDLTSTAAVTGVMISSILNICGRLSAPWISDRMERKSMLLLLFIISMTSILTLIIARGYFFILCVALVSYCYGGFFGIFPVVVTDYFGTQYSGLNYGMVMIGYGCMSLICPSIVTLGISISFVVAGFACVIGMICTLFMRHPIPRY